ncbi:LysR family transcriptional regulator [Ancylobacter oerskovii]|uniref:LysR family transcriptional regulator n=1 Tax=Ancylobacter oerskovii TaxID=459519 RepID=A0ABW4Z0V1_9HYPH|nr:LysR family transcriptional regulator [Ancylobacter oerskovii]MBS7541510.1 LysR family transcriptional regulator [Ancylobacter oerskovii]
MRREDMADLAAFAIVVEERNFTRAATKLGLSQSALSQIVKRLEERLGVALIARTTRSVAPTPAGERLWQTLAPMLRDLDQSLAALGEFRDKPSGTIRITSVEHAAKTILLPAVATLIADYPDIDVEIVTTYELSDVVAEGFDAGVRLGEHVSKDMVAVRMGPDIPMAIIAAPGYLSQRPVPSTPHDLAGHRGINLRLPTPGTVNAWRLGHGGREIRVRVDGPLILNTIELILDAALAGLGLAYLPLAQVDEHLRQGRLVEVLGEWTPPLPGYHLYYASRRQTSPAFRLLLNAVRYRV